MGFTRTLSHGASLGSPALYATPGRLEDLPVEAEDDQKRNVERGARGEDLVGDILAGQASLLHVDAVEVVRVLPAELRGQ